MVTDAAALDPGLRSRADNTAGSAPPPPADPSLDVPAPSYWDWAVFWFMCLIHGGFPITNTLFGIKPRWTAEEMGSKRDQVILVTGANSGTGYETAKAYYDKGAKVYVGCRSESRAREAIAEIKKGGSKDIFGVSSYAPTQTPGELIYINIDLADLTTVERAAKEILAAESRLDVLFANAGVMAVPPGQFTTQGYSLQFGTNVVGHQRLIARLIPLLQRTSQITGTPSRLIITSSLAHQGAPFGPPSDGGINYAALKRGGTQLTEWTEYGESKWGNIALAKYVNLKYGPSAGTTSTGEILAYSVHPGPVATNLTRHLSFIDTLKAIPFAIRTLLITPAQGALNQLFAANMPLTEAVQNAGGYISVYQKFVPPRPDLTNPQTWVKLWDWCEAESKAV